MYVNREHEKRCIKVLTKYASIFHVQHLIKDNPDEVIKAVDKHAEKMDAELDFIDMDYIGCY